MKMKIVRNTPDQLILKSVPWVIGITLIAAILGMTAAGLNGLVEGEIGFGLMMLAIGPGFVGLFFAIFVRRDDLILDRSRNLLELRHSTVLGRNRIRHDLSHLTRAIVQTTQSSEGGNMHRVALILDGGMDAGTHPVTQVYASGNGAKRAADAINDWLRTNVDSGSARV